MRRNLPEFRIVKGPACVPRHDNRTAADTAEPCGRESPRDPGRALTGVPAYPRRVICRINFLPRRPAIKETTEGEWDSRIPRGFLPLFF